MSYQTVKNKDNGKWKRLIWGILIVLLLFASVIVVNLQLTEISITGNRNREADVLAETILPEGWDRNPLVAAFKNRFLPHKTIPFVSSYDVRLTGPQSCEIIVYEKTPLGYVDYMSSYMYFDKDGTIIESTDTRIDGVPEITGLKFGSIVLGQKLRVDSVNLYEEIMNITQQLSTYNIPCEKIEFDENRNATLYIDGGDIRVKIGKDDYLAAKISVIGDIIEGLRERGLKGTVDLSNYTDRNVNGFIFEPDK